MYSTTQVDMPMHSGPVPGSLLNTFPDSPPIQAAPYKPLLSSDISNMVEMANRRAGIYDINPGTLPEIEQQQLKRARKLFRFNFPDKEFPMQLADENAYRNYQNEIINRREAEGTSLGASSVDPNIYGPTQSAIGDTRVSDPFGGPGLDSPPRFTANNGAIRTRHIMESDRTDPNFNSPFAAGVSPLNLSPEDRALQQQNFNSPQQKGGILATNPEETNDRSGWDRDERWRNASNRDKDWQKFLGMGLLNIGNNIMRPNTF